VSSKNFIQAGHLFIFPEGMGGDGLGLAIVQAALVNLNGGNQ